jgi:hypothetical protein
MELAPPAVAWKPKLSVLGGEGAVEVEAPPANEEAVCRYRTRPCSFFLAFYLQFIA